MLAVSNVWLTGALVLLRHAEHTHTRLDGIIASDGVESTTGANKWEAIDVVELLFRYPLQKRLTWVDSMTVLGEESNDYQFPTEEVEKYLHLLQKHPFVGVSAAPAQAFQCAIDAGVGSAAYPSSLMASLLRSLPPDALCEIGAGRRNAVLQNFLHMIHAEWLERICSELVFLIGAPLFRASLSSSSSSSSSLLSASTNRIARDLNIELVLQNDDIIRSQEPILRDRVHPLVNATLEAKEATTPKSSKKATSSLIAAGGLRIESMLHDELKERRDVLPSVLNSLTSSAAAANAELYSFLSPQPRLPQLIGFRHGLNRRIARTNYRSYQLG